MAFPDYRVVKALKEGQWVLLSTAQASPTPEPEEATAIYGPSTSRLTVNLTISAVWLALAK